MERRKRIGLFVSYPELTHVRRIIEGIMIQCEKYDYDLCVFASTVHLSFPHVNYTKGEANIFDLANFDELDGVILDSTTLIGDKDDQISKKLLERLSHYESLPKCALELPLGDIHTVKNENEDALREEIRHIIEVHDKKRLCILTGQKGNSVAEERLGIFLDEIKKHGLDVLPEHIVYGDFYYTSGDALANRIADGEIPMPEAVVCASDCMAIGLMDRLIKRGIKVPEDIAVIGFDFSDEGAVNTTIVASLEPAEKELGANAVDYIRDIIEPGAEITPFRRALHSRFHAGSSCGCQMDLSYTIKRFRDYIYMSSFNIANEELDERVGLGTFMEGYVLEGFTASKSAEECIENIYNYSTLLKPYRNFYLCLKEDWLNMDDTIFEGYPEKMKVYISGSRIGGNIFFGEEKAVSFPTGKMLPSLDEKKDKASVYYFSSVHFDGLILGFAVLERELCTHPVINIVYRNWLRYINNALEMIRSKERLVDLSVRDMMTGALNRRGMYEEYRTLLSSAQEGDSLLVCVADMDGLKYINDTFGHSEGDFGIKKVCQSLMSVAGSNEICVRSGGDEFFLIGIGKYTREDEKAKADAFTEAVANASTQAGKPYNISASIGCMVFPDCRSVSLDNALSEADEKMYRYKFRNKKQRGV